MKSMFLFLGIGTVFATAQIVDTDFDAMTARADQRQIAQDFAGAEKLRREALRLAKQSLPEGDARLAKLEVKLAVLLNAENRPVEAEELAHKAYTTAWRANDQKFASYALSALGVSLVKQGHDERAEPVLRRAKELMEQTGAKGTIDEAIIGNSLAAAYTNQREFAKAAKELAWVLPVYEKAYGAESPELVLPLTNMTTVLISERRTNEAEPYLTRALRIARQAFPNSMKLTALEENQAAFEALRGNLSESARLYQQVLNEEARLLGERSPQMARTLLGYAYVMRQAHKTQLAVEYTHRAQAMEDMLP